MSDIRNEVKEFQIGMKIRNMRQERRMTLQDLADKTGLSKPLLSQVENDQVIPPLATLLRIAKAFGISLHLFFEDDQDTTKCVLIRAGEQRSRQLRASQKHGDQAYSYASRALGKTRHHMEPFDVEFLARHWSEDMMVRHDGEEFMLLLSGQVEFRHGEQRFRLNPGDSVYYDSTEPHGYICLSDETARGVAVLYSKA